MEKLINRSACALPTVDEPVVYFDEDDFTAFNRSLSEIKEHAEKLYNSHKRYIDRAYLQDGKIYLKYENETIHLKETSIQSIILHIEKALEFRYVDVVNFSDMGHSHLFYPKDIYGEVGKLTTTRDKISFLLNHPETKILYHVSEQIRFLDPISHQLLLDPILQFKYYTRNILGDNKAQGKLDILFNFESTSKYNTVNNLDNHVYYSAGFYLHASRGGCFSYKHQGKEFFFDISLSFLLYKDKSLDFFM